MIKALIFLSLIFATFTNASQSIENNVTKVQNSNIAVVKKDKLNKSNRTKRLEELIAQKDELNKKITTNSIWSKIYSNYHTYRELNKQKVFIENKINSLSKLEELTTAQTEILELSKSKEKILKGKLQLLKEYENDPFKKFLIPPKIENIPTVENPFSIIKALSYLKKLRSDLADYDSRYESMKLVRDKLLKREALLKEMLKLDEDNKEYQEELMETIDQINTFIPVLEIFKTTQNVFVKKVDEIKLNLQNDIKKEMEKATSIGMIILFFILSTLAFKYLVRRYMSDTDRYYTINKALNITFGTLLLFTLLFAYLENVDYLVTILGFASAGIAIAMKDWFMSILGWFVIVIGGSIHVGDRVKFVREGMEYVGDIVDISLLRMTIQEDITLTTYMHNRRAGRIIFVPNNYVFTDMIANYSHAGLKTVWDGIDFMITFDSNVSKASSIAKEVAKKYSKGYTEITRKQLNKLRSQYSMKNTNVEPRIYTFIEPYGIKISVWYHTNSYATLTLRSTISMEIIERLQQEKDIDLAFPSQSVYIDKSVPRRQEMMEEMLGKEGLQ
ncbi:MscS family mechanosensitive ion channel [hydrothermal vent metagenome]|uniref:MscS family mechanosensitive ion channel n=1 Tax=hydrothermal vent metagenome TaxID=652676 RepID=A0A1W1EBL5_9ZZZZ